MSGPQTLDTRLGVTRFELACEPELDGAVLAAIRGWAEDRVLSEVAIERLVVLVRAANAHGLRFDPKEVVVLIRWLDPDRVRVDLQWLGGAETARATTTGHDVESTMLTLDTLSDAWGVDDEASGRLLWMVLDTR